MTRLLEWLEWTRAWRFAFTQHPGHQTSKSGGYAERVWAPLNAASSAMTRRALYPFLPCPLNILDGLQRRAPSSVQHKMPDHHVGSRNTGMAVMLAWHRHMGEDCLYTVSRGRFREGGSSYHVCVGEEEKKEMKSCRSAASSGAGVAQTDSSQSHLTLPT